MPVTELYAFNLICEILLAALYGVAYVFVTESETVSLEPFRFTVAVTLNV